MEAVSQLVSQASDFLWNVVLIILLCGTGIYFTIRLRFIQVRKFREGCRLVFGHMRFKGEKSEAGEMTPFQSVAHSHRGPGGNGKLNRRRHRSHQRRSRCHLLDVDERVFRHGHHLLRGSAGPGV